MIITKELLLEKIVIFAKSKKTKKLAI